jgi:hypothetical protein
MPLRRRAPGVMRKTVAGLISRDRLGRRWKIIHSGGKIFICCGEDVKLLNADQMKPDIASARFMGS